MIVSIIALAALAIFAFYAAGKVLPRMGDSMLKFKFEEMKQRGGAWKLFALFAEGNDDEVNTMRKLFSGKGVKWLAVTLGIVFVAGWLVTGCNGSLPTPGTPDEPESEALQKDDDWTPPECGEAYGYTGPLRNIEPCAEPVPVDPSPRYLDPENPADPTWEGPDPEARPAPPVTPEPSAPIPPDLDLDKRGIMPGEVIPPATPRLADGWHQLWPEVRVLVREGVVVRAEHVPPNIGKEQP